MTKRPSLFKVKAAEPEAEDAAPFALTEASAKPRAERPPSRAGKRILSIYLDPLAWKQLRMLAIEANTTTQALGEEAINLLFAKHQINRSA
jgi:antitoxin-like ribbon-helix-helix protein